MNEAASSPPSRKPVSCKIGEFLKLVRALQTWPYLVISPTAIMLLSSSNYLLEKGHRMIWVLCPNTTGLVNVRGRTWSQWNPKTELFTDRLKAFPEKNNVEEHRSSAQPWITLLCSLKCIIVDFIKTSCKLLHFWSWNAPMTFFNE